MRQTTPPSRKNKPSLHRVEQIQPTEALPQTMPRPLSLEARFRMQQTHGNQAVMRMVRGESLT
ncbi:MAG: hypothetical protein MUF87_22250, partial [Anaerolineae bacterium]|nr:hypothetical protein [Anaerolineae bacterium]